MTRHTTTRQPMDLADYIRELTETHTHAEHYTVRVGTEWRGRNHHVRVPSLLTQLWENDIPSGATEDGPRAGYASKPAARLDALDTAARIDLEASAWVRDLGEPDRHLDTTATIRQLHGLSASADFETRRAITTDVRRWWIRARIVTGWDSPAWTPDNTCPSCSERGTLRVRLADHIGTCVNDACRIVWDEGTIGLLADHIRVESAAERTTRPGVGPCWCPWPAPDVPNLKFMCSRCGSARCWHAVQARLLAAVADQRVGA